MIELQQRLKFGIFQKAQFSTLVLSTNFFLNAVPIAVRRHLWWYFSFFYWKLISIGALMNYQKSNNYMENFHTISDKTFIDFSCYTIISLRDKWSGTPVMFIIWYFTNFQSRSDSSQVKRSLISGITILVYQFPHKLAKDLRLRILAK